MIGLGDLTENCYGFYDSQPFNIELSMIEQYALARSMIMKTIETFLPHADKLKLAGCPGNHGEASRSQKGQVVTNRLDNTDTMHLQICEEIMKANPERYKNVSVEIPDGFHQVMDIKGITCGWTHGHMTGLLVVILKQNRELVEGSDVWVSTCRRMSDFNYWSLPSLSCKATR